MVAHESACQDVGGKEDQQGGDQHGVAHFRTGGGTNKDAIPEEVGFRIGDHLRIVGQCPENDITPKQVDQGKENADPCSPDK